MCVCVCVWGGGEGGGGGGGGGERGWGWKERGSFDTYSYIYIYKVKEQRKEEGGNKICIKKKANKVIRLYIFISSSNMVSDRLIPPSCLKFFDDKSRHVTVILQLAP